MNGLGAFRASYRAELVRLVRRRAVVTTTVVTVGAAIAGALIVLASVGTTSDGRAPTVAELSRAGGGTQVFRTAASFLGTFLFVVFVAVVALEFGRGTMRTMLLRQPRRLSLLSGKIAAIATVTAVVLAAGEVVCWLTALVDAPSHGVTIHSWTSLAGLGAASTDYLAILVWVAGYLVFASCVAVLTRSVAVALAVGFAWAGPIEHIVHNAWPHAARIFPGLSLEAFVARGTPDVGAGHALVVALAYSTIAIVAAAVAFVRWDVTS